MKNVAATSGHKVRRIDFFRGAAVEVKGCEMLAEAVAVANSDGFLLKATHSHHRVSLEILLAAPGRLADFPGISAKLVRSCEITANFHRCKIIFGKY